ncbi:MAG TPA: hypothetical protein VGC47_03335 [Acidimicrobiia bacterium]|jgi:hypothetical protein
MATDKRARQRANRELKAAEELKAERRRRIFTTGKRILIWAAAFALLVWVTTLIFGGGSDTESLRFVSAL